MKAVILGGTKGIGKAIADELKGVCDEVNAVGSADVDTTDLNSVRNFINNTSEIDVLVLNTGGPPPISFDEITDEIWLENFNKLFLSFSVMMQEMRINPGGYIFLISSFVIKEPNDEIPISSSIRAGFSNLFKAVSITKSKEGIRLINIAPGPIQTDRLLNLLNDDGQTIEDLEHEIPGGKVPEPNEIGLFVKFVVENQIKALNGVTIPFDSGLLRGVY